MWQTAEHLSGPQELFSLGSHVGERSRWMEISECCVIKETQHDSEFNFIIKKQQLKNVNIKFVACV